MKPETPPLVPSYLPAGYDPFAAADRPPPVVTWLRAYAAFLGLCDLVTLGYVAYVAITWADLAHRRGSRPPPAAFEALGAALAAAFALFALAHLAACAYALACPRKPASHALGIVVLVMSFLSTGGCMPAGVILLVYWLRPEVKAWFADGASGAPAGPPPAP